MSKFGGIPLDGGSRFGGIPLEQSQPIDDDVPQLDAQGNLIDTYQPPEKPERTAGDVAQGIYETGRGIVQGAAGTPLYVAGAIEGIYKRFTEDGFSPEDAAKYANEAASYFVTPPESQTGKDIAGFIGDVGGALPPVLGVAAGAIPNVATGIQGARVVKDAASAQAVNAIDKLPQRQPMTERGRRPQELADMIQNDPNNLEAARFELNPTPKPQTVTEALKQKVMPPSPVKESKVSIDAIKQGFDEGVVQPIKASNQATKKIMTAMLKAKDRERKDKLGSLRNRPGYLIGDEIKKRGLSVLQANRDAGKQIDKAAQALKGKPADAMPIVDSFRQSLDSIGVKLTGDGRLDFSGSDIEGNTAAENAINNVVNRMKKGGNLDAYDLHRMKKFIDDKVTYGKNAEGLAGIAESKLKDLRRTIDEQLDSNYPDYDAANTAYKETREGLDTLQDVAGKKFDITGDNSEKRLGLLTRRIMSNAQSAGDVITALDDLTSVANKYMNYRIVDNGEFLLPDLNASSRKKFDANLDMLALFSDELDNRFKPSARTSFENLTTRQAQNDVKNAADAMTTQGQQNIILEQGGKVLNKARGVNDDNAFKAMYELLRD
jgi:hypothetical protein